MDTNIQKYKAFITTVETGSFSKAAEVLAYSQSGISRMIKDIEDEWHVSLLERNKKGVKLTSDGTKLLPYATALVREYEELTHALEGLSELESGLIKIGAFQGISGKYLADVTSRFSCDFPGIDFQIMFGGHGQVEEWLLTGQVDVGFLKYPPSVGLESEFVYQERLVAVLPVREQTDADVFPISSCKDVPFILYDLPGENDVSALLKRCNVSPQIKATVADAAFSVSLIKSGMGMAILPESTVREIPTEGVAIKDLDVPAYVEIGAAIRSRRESSVATRKFIQYV